MAARNKASISSRFLNLNVWAEAIKKDSSWGHPHPASMPTSVIVALHKAVALVLQEGLDNRLRRHAEAGTRMKRGMQEMGLDLFTDSDFYSNTVSVAKVDPRWDGAFRSGLVKEYNIMIAGGLGPLTGKIIRVGHMGTSAKAYAISLTLDAMADLLKRVRR